MSYPCPTIPANPNAWSESLNPTEGYWNYADLDTGFVKVPNASIRSQSDIMWLTFHSPIDLSHLDRLAFWCALEPDPYGTDTVGVTIRDQDGNQVVAEIYVPPVKIFNFYDLSLSTFEGNSIDWSRIISIWFGRGGTGRIWIDAPHFYIPPMYIDTAIMAMQNSEEISKFMSIEGNGLDETFMTPKTFALKQCDGTGYIIEADATNFLQWEDGNTNPVRTYIPVSDATLIAYYAPLIHHTVTIDSEPQGKTVEIDGVRGITPVTWTVSPGTYTIKLIDTMGFLNWENEDTNATRVIDVNKDISLMAYYSGDGDGPSDGIPGNLGWLLLLAMGSVAGLGLIYRWAWRRRMARKRLKVKT